MTLAVNVP